MSFSRGFPRSPALSPNLKNRLKYIYFAYRVPIAPALLILGDEIANLATLELTEGLGPRAVPALGSLFPLAQDPIQLMRDCTWCSSSALFFGVHEHLHHDLIILSVSVSPSPPLALGAWLGSRALLLSNLAQLRT